MRTQFPVLRLFENFDDYFSRGISPQPFNESADIERTYAPAMSSKETDSAFLLTAELPGVKKENLKIDIAGRILTISGENPNRGLAKFSRAVTIPENIETTKVEAHLEDGLLHIALPKAASTQKRSIEIQSGRTGFFSKLLSGTSEQ